MERKLNEGISKRLRTHMVTIDNRELMTITGVTQVDSFNEFEICLVTDIGELAIEGNDLSITKLDLDDGQVVVEGEIIALEYTDSAVAPKEKASFFSRMFK